MVPMSRTRRIAVVTAAALTLSVLIAACAASTPQTASTAPTVTPSPEDSAVVGSVAVSEPTPTTSPSAAEAAASFAPDACATLIPKSEIEAAIGGTVGKLEVNGKSDAVVGIPPYRGDSLCWYPITNGIFVQVAIGHAPDAASLASALATFKAKNPGEDVSGLGDAAYSTSDNGLMVIEGSRLVVVTIFSSDLDTAAAEAAQVSLVKKVLERW